MVRGAPSAALGPPIKAIGSARKSDHLTAACIALWVMKVVQFIFEVDQAVIDVGRDSEM